MRLIRITVTHMPWIPAPAAPPPSPEPAPAQGSCPPDTSATPSGARRRLRSDALFGGANEIQIEHGGALYRLRITSLGKLILTK